jgi:hypothetical protein
MALRSAWAKSHDAGEMESAWRWIGSQRIMQQP